MSKAKSENLPKFPIILSGKFPNVADFCPPPHLRGAAAIPATPSPMLMPSSMTWNTSNAKLSEEHIIECAQL